MVRGNLRRFEEEDGNWIESYLNRQLSTPRRFPLSESDNRKLVTLTVKTQESKEVEVSVPTKKEQEFSPKSDSLLTTLPLNYDTITLRTIENIDVLWIKGRSIVRAFAVEHTTSIYSGILRMADLMALQPNLDISAHIVAPAERREKVLQEISRPVFALLEKGPLKESCTFISYEAVSELSLEKRLEYMNDKVLDEYQERAGDLD